MLKTNHINKILKEVEIDSALVDRQYHYLKNRAIVRGKEYPTIKQFKNILLQHIRQFSKEDFKNYRNNKMYIVPKDDSYMDFYVSNIAPKTFYEEKASEIKKQGWHVCPVCGDRKKLTPTFWKKSKATKIGYELHACKSCINKQNKNREIEKEEALKNIALMLMEKNKDYL